MGSKDPINRLEKQLLKRGVSREYISKLEGEIKRRIEKAFKFAEDSPEPQSNSMPSNAYAPKDTVQS